MELYLVELAKLRAPLLKSIIDTSSTFTGYDKKVTELNKQLEKIDALIDQCFEGTTKL